MHAFTLAGGDRQLSGLSRREDFEEQLRLRQVDPEARHGGTAMGSRKQRPRAAALCRRATWAHSAR
ncbi:protein of unknown function (plasmid) [Cupriavidus taiwanensis]|nr:protein of unknown function [Cupriavidus taiwanensis]